MLGGYEKDGNNQAICYKCKQPMLLVCFGGWWLCPGCDYVQLATDWMSKQASKNTPAFLAEHKNHDTGCMCKKCKEKQI
jgi:hypothetical protein